MDLTFFYVCHCSIKGRIFSLVAVERPQDLILSCVRDLWCDVGGIGALTLGEDTEYSFFLQLFTSGCTLLCHLSPFVQPLRLH